MAGEFLLFKKTAAIKSYSVRGLKILKELKRHSEDVYKFVKKQLLSNIISNEFTILKPVSVLRN